ncbi:MAG TPA: hypothetical protein VFO65_14025, partial [Acidimicrobiales bacterium]|nr:hypothetical protein [Acidimicrobiales bacterium]
FVLSPLVAQLSLTYLPYGTSLALELAAALAALRAVRTRRRWAAAGAGLALGTAAFARPYDAVLAGLALALALLVRERHRLRPLLPLLAPALAGAALPVLGLLLYNRAMTGDPLRLAFLLLEPADRPGLGLRRALPTDPLLDFTAGRAATALGRSLLLVVAWTAGGALTAALAVATLVRRRLRATAVPVALLLVWPAGYALFWGSYVATVVWGGALFLGPYYHLPMVAMLAVAGGVGLADLWTWRPAVATVTAAAMVLLSVPVLVPALEEQADRNAARQVVADLVDSRVETPALVFVPPVYGPYLQNPFSFLRNRPDLDGPVVYALDGDAGRNERVLEAHPDRAAYRLVLDDGWSDDPGFAPAAHLERLRPASM